MFKKIDIYRVNRNAAGRRTGVIYLCSTNKARTCREAVEGFRTRAIEAAGELVAYFDKGAR